MFWSGVQGSGRTGRNVIVLTFMSVYCTEAEREEVLCGSYINISKGGIVIEISMPFSTVTRLYARYFNWHLYYGVQVQHQVNQFGLRLWQTNLAQ